MQFTLISKDTAFCEILGSTSFRVRVGTRSPGPGQSADFWNVSLYPNFGTEFADKINDLEGIRILGGTWLLTKLIFWRFQLLYLQAWK